MHKFKSFKLGYKYEGKSRLSDVIGNKFSDHFYFGLLKNELKIKIKIK